MFFSYLIKNNYFFLIKYSTYSSIKSFEFSNETFIYMNYSKIFQLMCCGVWKPDDWQTVSIYKDGRRPPSCCTGYDYYGYNNFSCPSYIPKYNNESAHKLYKTPCSKQVTELVSQTSFLLTTGAICVAFIQVNYFYHRI